MELLKSFCHLDKEGGRNRAATAAQNQLHPVSRLETSWCSGFVCFPLFSLGPAFLHEEQAAYLECPDAVGACCGGKPSSLAW